MSSIAGFVNFCRSRPDPATIQRMQLAMTPYGRDAQHHLCTAQGAFCRTLLRTTPEDALDRQPLVHTSTGSVLLFDGRIDNRDELAARLSITADELKTLADSDIVQRGLLEKGTDFIEHLIGDFALAWFNRAEQQLHLARDAMGIRPIYWHRTGNTLVFATLPKGLFAHPGIAREIDRTTVNDFLCLLPQQGERSFYQGVQRVEPGRHVVFTQNGQRKRVFFDVTKPAELVNRSDQEHIEALREMTERAVISQLRANSPVATELSSGKDSSLVTAITAREMARRGQRIQTWTSVPRPGFSEHYRRRGFLVDESIGAKALAAMHDNIDHRFFHLEDQTPLDDLDAFVEAMDRMPLNACNLIWSNGIKKRAAEDGHRVLLNGGMGNFTISHDGVSHLPDLLLSGRIRSWIRECRAMSRHKRRVNWRRLLEFSLGPIMPKRVWMALEHRRGIAWDLGAYSAIGAQQRDALFKTQRWDLSYRPVRDGRQLMASCLTRMDLGDYYAAYNSFGLEVRSPLVDRRLIALCQSIPQALFFRDGQQSWILRQALGDLLPDEILKERKKGLQAADWFEPASRHQTRFAAAVKELQDNATAAEMLDLASLDQLVDQWPETGWENIPTDRAYRLKLLRGLSAGAFIRYVEDKNL